MKLGSSLPKLTVDATGEQRIALPDLKGQYAVIYFYPKDSTPGCTTESRDFNALLDEFAAEGATVVGVSRDSVKSHENFRTRQELRFDLLSDPEEALCKAFDVIHEKNMYGRKVLGVVRSTFLFGPDGKLRREWRGVKVKGHAQEVLDAIRADRAG